MVLANLDTFYSVQWLICEITEWWYRVSHVADRFCHPFAANGLITGAIKFHAIINNKLQYIDAHVDRWGSGKTTYYNQRIFIMP